MRKICFSDIHGHLKTFEAALDQWAFSKSDELFLLGDYVDRGPDSKGVVDLVQKMQREGHTVRCLMGNHEELVVRDWEEEMIDPGARLGDWATLTSFGAERSREIPMGYIEWMRELPSVIEVDGYILVHAGLNFERSDPFSDEKAMRTIRYWHSKIDREWLAGRSILHGHTPMVAPDIWALHQKLAGAGGQVLNIDNGCFMPHRPGFGCLCSFEMTGRELRFEPNRDV